ncbi:MAG: metal-dependent hydrolase [Halobacteriaceae archaeon]
MFAGHALLAAGIAGLLARHLGASRQRALRAAGVAGAFGMAPDIDIIHAAVGLSAAGSLAEAPEAFWRTSTVLHRGVTHSLVIGAGAAAVAWSARVKPVVGVGLSLAILGVVATTAGPVAMLITGAFLGVVVAIATVAGRMGTPPETVGGAALVGLLTHPFGDLFTGTPPALLFPFEVTIIDARVAPAADPTLNLLLAFGVELAVLWFGLLALARVAGVSLRRRVGGRAALGAALGSAAFVLTPPTMAAAWHFVFPAIAVGGVGLFPVTDVKRTSRDRGPALLGAVVTGLAAVTLGVLSYTAVYLLM